MFTGTSADQQRKDACAASYPARPNIHVTPSLSWIQFWIWISYLLMLPFLQMKNIVIVTDTDDDIGFILITIFFICCLL